MFIMTITCFCYSSYMFLLSIRVGSFSLLNLTIRFKVNISNKQNCYLKRDNLGIKRLKMKIWFDISFKRSSSLRK